MSAAVVATAERADAPVADETGPAAATLRADVALIGCGQVGGALLRRLGSGTERGLRLVALANSRRSRIDAHGIAPAGAAEGLALAQPGSQLDAVADALRASRARCRVLVDATGSADVAARHAGWLAQGIHVVSANKLAQAGSWTQWQALRAAQQSGRTRYGDSATVGAGLPALSTLRRLVGTGDRLRSLEGVLSGSLSFLLNSFDGTRPFSELLDQARALGYTEPDPRADLSGQDVARKLLILARSAGIALEEHQIEIEPVFPQALARVGAEEFRARLPELDAWIGAQRHAAQCNGRVLRYLARFDAEGRASVRLQALLPEHPCARLQGSDNLFVLRSERYRQQPLVIQGPGAGPEVTAQGLLADALEIAG